jgi:hypothetical protein
MALRLRDNLHWCACAGRAVFLDIAADRYFCLPAVVNDAFIRLAACRGERGDAERLRQLVARGLLVEGSASAAIEPPPLLESPTADWPGSASERAGPAMIARALLAELSTARRLQTRSLLEVLDSARRAVPGAKRAERDRKQAIHRIVAASSTIAYLTRVQDRCLVRALAVHSLCRTKGIGHKLVFGVIANPFAAHCWVQLGRTVLVGGFEQARLYTPILVIE